MYVITNSSTAFLAHATQLFSSLLLFTVIVIFPLSLSYFHDPNLFSSVFPKFAEPSFPFVAFVEYATTSTFSAFSSFSATNLPSSIFPDSSGFAVICVFSIGYMLSFIPDFIFTCTTLFSSPSIVYVLFVIISFSSTFVAFLVSSSIL